MSERKLNFPDKSDNELNILDKSERDELRRRLADAPIQCPKCGSKQLTANKKGFGLGKAVTGAVAAGPVGLLGGFVGSRKVKITCLKCGHSWSPHS
jgi:hypothetical protein